MGRFVLGEVSAVVFVRKPRRVLSNASPAQSSPCPISAKLEKKSVESSRTYRIFSRSLLTQYTQTSPILSLSWPEHPGFVQETSRRMPQLTHFLGRRIVWSLLYPRITCSWLSSARSLRTDHSTAQWRRDKRHPYGLSARVDNSPAVHRWSFERSSPNDRTSDWKAAYVYYNRRGT